MEKPVEQVLAQGMYVRVGIDAERDDTEFRDYRVGQIATIDPIANSAVLALETHVPGQRPVIEHIEYALDQLERCRILPDTDATFIPTGRRVRVLLPCEDTCPPDQLCLYYAQIGEQVVRVSEADLTVGSSRQDPYPFDQLRHYELHNPIWRSHRDQAVESFAELHNATFGLEDLVGSRILLLAHQAEVIANVLGDPQCRYILADEVGLGKTIEACVILKGLQRRHPDMRTLIVVPDSLLQQWHNELNDKFWLDFAIAGSAHCGDEPGVIVSGERLAEDSSLWQQLRAQHWGLLIADEVHHLHKNRHLYECVRALSEAAERVLLLSATPIQRRSAEYLSLLALMDPARYGSGDLVAFNHVLDLQNSIRSAVVYLAPTLTADSFDPDEFVEEMEQVIHDLPHDTVLRRLVARVSTHQDKPSRSLAAARAALSYLSENYRIESRVIRNRRAHLKIALPTRDLDTSFSYEPGEEEAAVLDAVLDYAATYVRLGITDPLGDEYCRILLHAAASSPYALEAVLVQRQTALPHVPAEPGPALPTLTTPAAPREERARIEAVIRNAASVDREGTVVSDLLWLVGRWRDAVDASLAEIVARPAVAPQLPSRLGQTLLAIHRALRLGAETKVLVFTSWPETVAALATSLRGMYKQRCVAEFHAGVPNGVLQGEADRFQQDVHCRIMLCDELGGEGRNFQIANQIVHVDLPWTPAQIEQRIGRVDRLGRSGTVLSIVPYAHQWPEHDLFRIWQEAFRLFTESMSGLEIALEGVQDELVAAIARNPRHGLGEIVEQIVGNAAQLREDVNKERYFEERAVNQQRRREFQQIGERYRDGSLLRASLLGWGDLAGLQHEYDWHTDIVTFDPRRFKQASMKNAKFFQPPNMEEALHRSGRPYDYVIKGTFNRDIAVRREDLVFYAPGNDPWIDALITNAVEADRGRACAILRPAPALDENWQGCELLFSLNVDPRPLYALGYNPVHLFRAQGFLTLSTQRLLISTDGEVIGRSSPLWKIIAPAFDKHRDRHLGKRGGSDPLLQHFKRRFPPAHWSDVLDRIAAAATGSLIDDLSFMAEEADYARKEFARRAAGWRAARQWLLGDFDGSEGMADIDDYGRISEALVEGIGRPVWRLESACFWLLSAGVGDRH